MRRKNVYIGPTALNIYMHEDEIYIAIWFKRQFYIVQSHIIVGHFFSRSYVIKLNQNAYTILGTNVLQSVSFLLTSKCIVIMMHYHIRIKQ